jgi:endonuclease-3
MPRQYSKREPLIGLKKRAKRIRERLGKAYPDATVALHHQSPLELLIATILSAQCTDARVNIVTQDLFKKYRTADDYATADRSELEQDIRSTGFYRMKAKNIINCCTALVERHHGNVPGSMEELTQLAGVGRKTANVVLSNAFGRTEGIVVDTHVRRLAQRLGWTKAADPEKVERDLMKIIPQNEWKAIDDLLIWHGRNTCIARRPKCSECPVKDLCPSAKDFLEH